MNRIDGSRIGLTVCLVGLPVLLLALLFASAPAAGARVPPGGLPATARGAETAHLTFHLWQIETVDSDGNVGQYTSLALDAAGRPHISYCNYYGDFNGNLKFARYDGVIWHIETVDEEYVCHYASLALDAVGHPHISYRDWYNSDLKFARYDGEEWQIETVDSDGWVGGYTSLALDAAGRPHISYRDESNTALKFARHDGAEWQIETVDSDGNVGLYTSLALDGAGRPHISYHEWFNAALKFARYDGEEWQIETVDSDGNVGHHTSLALDAAGRPHISYHDATNGNLKFARHDGAEWQIETVDSDGNVGHWTSLALDAAGHPHISYCDATNTALKFARHGGEEWEIETVESDGNVGLYTSLALDGAGRPRISYRDTTNTALKFAWQYELPLEADFSGTPTSGVAPLTVTFENLSSGNYDTSLWGFGDGLTSTLEHPTHEYELPGAYTVTLTVSGMGGTDTLTRTNYITVYEPVEAGFFASPTAGLAPLTVAFTNTSTGDYDTSLWLFGDGITSTLPNPVHIYPTGGTYTVTLTVSGPGGTYTATKDRYITVQFGTYLPVLLRNP